MTSFLYVALLPMRFAALYSTNILLSIYSEIHLQRTPSKLNFFLSFAHSPYYYYYYYFTVSRSVCVLIECVSILAFVATVFFTIFSILFLLLHIYHLKNGNNKSGEE